MISNRNEPSPSWLEEVREKSCTKTQREKNCKKRRQPCRSCGLPWWLFREGLKKKYPTLISFPTSISYQCCPFTKCNKKPKYGGDPWHGLQSSASQCTEQGREAGGVEDYQHNLGLQLPHLSACLMVVSLLSESKAYLTHCCKFPLRTVEIKTKQYGTMV